MAKLAKALSAAAGNAAGDPVYVEDVFSTYLYTGNDGTQTITTGIDVSGEGGLIWQKPRTNDSTNNDHKLFDTARGQNKVIYSNLSAVEDSGRPLSYTSTGFTLDAGSQSYGLNKASVDYTSWTFRKQKGFFDCVKFTTTGGGGTQTISHNLGSIPGMIIIKKLTGSGGWHTWHKGITSPNSDWWKNYGHLEANYLFQDWGSTNAIYEAPTSAAVTLGIYYTLNAGDYVAYFFAEGGSDDQIFGDNGDEATIKCVGWTGNGSTQDINLGFEPQWSMIKNTTNTGYNWYMLDSMRGAGATAGSQNYLAADLSDAEGVGASMWQTTSTGVRLTNDNSWNKSGSKYLGVFIRRGPMKEPSAGTDVYIQDLSSSTTYESPFFQSPWPVDLGIYRKRTSTEGNYASARITGTGYLIAQTTAASNPDNANVWDFMNGYYDLGSGYYADYAAIMFRRYPKVFDVVYYSPLSTDPNPKNVHNHNLKVKPELIIVKQTTAVYASRNWAVGAPDLLGVTSSDTLGLNLDVAEGGSGTYDLFASTQPTATQFTVGYNSAGVGVFGESYVAYLFATLAGVSKVGTYTGTGNTLNVDCGFSGGARFVMIKRTDSTGDWYVFDTTVQGIIAGDDPYWLMNSNAADVTNTDYIDPLSSGFTLTSSFTAGTYLFLAFA